MNNTNNLFDDTDLFDEVVKSIGEISGLTQRLISGGMLNDALILINVSSVLIKQCSYINCIFDSSDETEPEHE